VSEKERVEKETEHWQQGIPIGILDNAVDTLLSEPSGRIRSYGEFEAEYSREDSAVRRAVERIGYLFEGFHPGRRPVLWRVLVAQAHLYRALLETWEGRQLAEDLQRLTAFADLPEKPFDWRGAQQTPLAAGQEEPGRALEVARRYLRERVSPLLMKELRAR
jgi:hypothetical protein